MIRLSNIILATAAILAAAATAARAQVLFTEDFQDGDADGWSAGGDGDVGLTQYAGNVSMRLTKSATATIGLRVEGPPRVAISGAFAAQDLERRDGCVLEAAFGDDAFVEMHRIGNGQDDAVTLHRGGGELNVPTAGAVLRVRLRADSNGDDDTCWADDIQVASAVVRESRPLGGPREALFAVDLRSGAAPAVPLPTNAFAPADGAGRPRGSLGGRLTIKPTGAPGFRVLTDRFGFLQKDVPNLRRPPEIIIDVVQSGDRLVPAVRGLTRTDHAAWDVIVDVGRAWREGADGGATRVAFPFALQERNANCTHNGLLTFVIDRRGRPSNAVYQIGSETCAYFQYDIWGAASVDYTPGEIVEAEAIKAAYGRETSGRMPTKPIAALRDDHPGLDAAAFANPADVSPAALTAFGVVVDGVHYRGGCETRYGPYPFCAEIALPSYSVSKSVFAGLGLMRLEKLYPGVKNTLIADHVPQCPKRGWRDVTFENALDMATGRYRSTEREADENAAVQDGFFIVETHAEKIARACGMYPRKSAPGKTWVYHTTDHYVLGSAMQSFLREKAGGDADIHRDLIVEPIWRTLPLSPVAERTRRTRDDVGQPYVGWGLTFLPDDYAKLADFVNAGGGRVGGGSQVDAGMLAAAMQRAPDDAGLSAGGPAFRYNNGFWAWNAAGAAGCDGALWTPFMSGFGGVSVVLMRNGVSYYYVSDGGEYAWARAVAASARYREMC